MSKTVEELLKPRFQVKAYWPDCPFTVGDILVPDFEEPDQYIVEGLGLRSPILNDSPTRWPHLFKELKWHEGWAIEDMPLYLRDDDNRIWKLSGWELDFLKRPSPTNVVDKEGETEMACRIAWHFRKDRMMPATEGEYNQYKSKKDGTVNG